MGTRREFESVKEALQNEEFLRDCNIIIAEGPNFSLAAFWSWYYGEVFRVVINCSGKEQRKDMTKREVLEFLSQHEKEIKKISISNPFSRFERS